MPYCKQLFVYCDVLYSTHTSHTCHCMVSQETCRCVWCMCPYPLHRATGKSSACQPCPQFKDVYASIFVEVQLVKQLSPALLSLLVWTKGFTFLAVRPREPSLFGSHNCQSELADGIQGHQFNHHSQTQDSHDQLQGFASLYGVPWIPWN